MVPTKLTEMVMRTTTFQRNEKRVETELLRKALGRTHTLRNIVVKFLHCKIAKYYVEIKWDNLRITF